MIMHKCNYMYMYNYYLALHSDGGEGRNAGSGGEDDDLRCWATWRGGWGRGRGGEVREGEIRGGRRCGATASEKGLCECARRVEGPGWRGKERG